MLDAESTAWIGRVSEMPLAMSTVPGLSTVTTFPVAASENPAMPLGVPKPVGPL